MQFIVEVSRETRTVVRRGKIVTEDFNTRKGVLQECLLSSHLFNLYLEFVMREALEEHIESSVKIGGDKI